LPPVAVRNAAAAVAAALSRGAAPAASVDLLAPVALASLGARVAATTVTLSVGGETRMAGVGGRLFDAPWIRNDVIKGESVGEDSVGEETVAGDGGMAATTTRNAVARPARPPPFGMKEEERASPVPSDAFCAGGGIAATRCQESSMLSRAAEVARVTALSQAHPGPILPHCTAVRPPRLQL